MTRKASLVREGDHPKDGGRSAVHIQYADKKTAAASAAAVFAWEKSVIRLRPAWQAPPAAQPRPR